jgi:hypothetical protein
MQTPIALALDNAVVGTPILVRNLTVLPLLAKESKPANYTLLDDALTAKTAGITEISEGGSVPVLKFENLGDKPVLLVDGEELVGARQNRVLNLSILAPAHSSIEIPVSCVEAGRWAYGHARRFSASGSVMFARARSDKLDSVSRSRRQDRSAMPRSDQGKVWDRIAEKSHRMGVHSASGSMDDVFRSTADDLGQILEQAKPIPGQIGAIFAIDGKVVGLDLFDSAETYARFAPKLLRSYGLDAIDTGAPTPDVVITDRIGQWLASLAQGEVEAFPGIGQGQDLRLRGEETRGAALVDQGEVVHFCAFTA